MAALRERTAIVLTKPLETSPGKRAKRRSGDIQCDEILFEKLRLLRRTLADGRNVPAYVIFSDATLREMARALPTTRAQFERIPGVGERKLKDFGDAFTDAVSLHVGGSGIIPP